MELTTVAVGPFHHGRDTESAADGRWLVKSHEYCTLTRVTAS